MSLAHTNSFITHTVFVVLPWLGSLNLCHVTFETTRDMTLLFSAADMFKCTSVTLITIMEVLETVNYVGVRGPGTYGRSGL